MGKKAGKENTSLLRKISRDGNPLLRASTLQRIMDIDDEVMLVEDAAEVLGISKWGVLKRIERGTIKAKKQGSRWYILKSKLVHSLRNG